MLKTGVTGVILLCCLCAMGCAKSLQTTALARSGKLPQNLSYGIVLNNLDTHNPALVSLINFELDTVLHKYGWQQVVIDSKQPESLPTAIVAVNLQTGPPIQEFSGFYEPRFGSRFLSGAWNRPSYESFGVREVVTYYPHRLSLEIYLTQSLLAPSLSNLIFGNNQDKSLSSVQVTAKTLSPQARNIFPQLLRVGISVLGENLQTRVDIANDLKLEFKENWDF